MFEARVTIPPLDFGIGKLRQKRMKQSFRLPVQPAGQERLFVVAWHRYLAGISIGVCTAPKDQSEADIEASARVFWICASELPQRTGTITEGQPAILLCGLERLLDRALQVVMHNLAQAEREIGNDVSG